LLFLRMVVWQPFMLCWRLIIARVSEMHVAYHTVSYIMGYLFIGTSQQQNRKARPYFSLQSYLRVM
jgi:hypothetical protein